MSDNYDLSADNAQQEQLRNDFADECTREPMINVTFSLSVEDYDWLRYYSSTRGGMSRVVRELVSKLHQEELAITRAAMRDEFRRGTV